MEDKQILLEEYRTLRSEITQSIIKQHQILLSGYALTFATVGYILGSEKSKILDSEFLGLVIIPIILFAMACLWVV